MDFPTFYNVGTASVSAAGTAVTGQGTAWLGAVRVGDLFWAAGLSVRIASVNSNTSLTLASGWPGSTRTTAAYEVHYVGDAVRVQEATREILTMLAAGNLSAFDALEGAANRLPYFTGAGALDLAVFTTLGRTLAGAADEAAAQTALGLASPTPDKAFRRGNVLGTVSQSSGVPTGALIERASNANGEYVRFADGTQICVHTVTFDQLTTASGALYRSESSQWVFPAAFAVAPSVLGRGTNGAFIASSTTAGPTVNSVFSRMYGSITTAASFGAQMTAIGRWF